MKIVINKINNKLKSTIVRYYLFSFFSSLHFFSAVLVPFFTDWGGIPLSQVQILQSWFMFWIFILEIPTGAVADYIGRKQSIFIGTFIICVAMIIYGSIPNFNIFLLGEFLFSAGVAFISGADEALLYDSLKEVGREKESKKIFGRANSFNLAGMLVAAPVGSIIAYRFGLNFPLLLSSIPTFFTFLIALTFKEPKYKSKISESRRYINIVKSGLVSLTRNRKLKKLVFNSVLISSSAYFVIWYYQPLLENVGVPIFYFGFIHSSLVIFEILISSNFEKIEKFLKGERVYMLFVAFVVAFSFIIVGLHPSFVTISLFIIFAGGFGLTYQQYISASMQQHIPSNERATVISSISMFRRLALVLLNPIMGYLADIHLSLTLSIISLISLCSIFFAKNID